MKTRFNFHHLGNFYPLKNKLISECLNLLTFARRLQLGILGIFFLLLSYCGTAEVDTFSSGDLTSEKTIKDELIAIAFAKCLETGGSDLKLLETYIFVDKLFSKSSGSQSQRDRTTYKKKEAENCRNNLILFSVEKCDFKPFDIANFLSDKKLCKLEPSSFSQF